MPRPFVAILPKPVSNGDEIIVKGKLKANAEVFSVNFTTDACDSPSYIVYQLRAKFPSHGTSEICHNYKSETWGEETIQENNYIDGPGQEFTLAFIFNENGIVLYSGENSNAIFQNKFVTMYNVSEIKVLQLWDDIELVKELVLRYNQ